MSDHVEVEPTLFGVMYPRGGVIGDEFDVVMDRDAHGTIARDRVAEAGIKVRPDALIGHFTIYLASAEDFILLGGVPGLSLRAPDPS